MVTEARYQSIIHDFVGVNALREIHTAQAAITRAVAFLRAAPYPIT